MNRRRFLATLGAGVAVCLLPASKSFGKAKEENRTATASTVYNNSVFRDMTLDGGVYIACMFYNCKLINFQSDITVSNCYLENCSMSIETNRQFTITGNYFKTSTHIFRWGKQQ